MGDEIYSKVKAFSQPQKEPFIIRSNYQTQTTPKWDENTLRIISDIYQFQDTRQKHARFFGVGMKKKGKKRKGSLYPPRPLLPPCSALDLNMHDLR